MPSIPEDELEQQIDNLLYEILTPVLAAVRHGQDAAEPSDAGTKKMANFVRQYAAKERLDETEKHQRALQRPPKGIDTGYMNIDLIEMNFAIRIKQLKKGVKT